MMGTKGRIYMINSAISVSPVENSKSLATSEILCFGDHHSPKVAVKIFTRGMLKIFQKNRIKN